MFEATAVWAEHYIYPDGATTYPGGNRGNSEHVFAPSFLEYPNLELESEFKTHEYGAYLWFFYITRGVDSGAHYVRETWDAAATHDSLGAIEQAIGSLGGFRGEWPQFVLYNWNRKKKTSTRFGVPGEREIGQPYRDYAKWDKLDHNAKEVTPDPVKVRLNGKASYPYPLAHTIPHLAARYFHYDFTADNAIRSLTFTHPYAGGSEPTAKVQAIVKIRGQEWKPAEDWTSFSQKTLCLDKPAEDVEELVIVISNSEFTNRSHDLSNVAELKVSALGCSPWIGTVDYSLTVDQVPDVNNQFNGEKVSETVSTTVTFEVSGPGFGFEKIYHATNGIATWHHVGSISSGELQCSGTGSGVADVGSVVGRLIVTELPPPLGDGSTVYYQGKGRAAAGMIFPYTCTSPRLPPSQRDVSFGAFDWFKTRLLSLDPDLNEAATIDTDGSLVMRGKFSEQRGDVTVGLHIEEWRWDLKQVRRPR